MAMPKKRMSHVRSGTRRSQIKLELPQITYCPKCHEARMAHSVCKNCGTYRGRQVITIKENAPVDAPVEEKADVVAEKKATKKKTVKPADPESK